MSVQKTQHLRWADNTWELWARWGRRRNLCRHRHLHLQWVGVQRLPGADQVFRRRLLRHLHLCIHQHRDFRLSFPRTHLQERLHRLRPDLMWCVPRRHPRDRQSRHRQWRVCQRRPRQQSRQRSKVLLGEFSHEHLHQREQWKRWLATMLQPEVQHLRKPKRLRRRLRLWTLWLRAQPWTSWPRFQTVRDMVMLILLRHKVLEDCQHWQCTSRRQWAHKLRRLHLQQEIPLWQEKHQDKVQPTGRMLRWYHRCHRHHRQHRWEARQRFVWHAKGVDCWTRRWICDCSDLSERGSSVWRGRLPKSHQWPPAPAAPATPAPAAPATPAPAAANPTGPGNGTEVSPSLSENSGRSRTPTRSGVCSVTEDGSMTMFDSGGNLLILELACGVDSVIQNASREFGSSYIGIHAGLELLSTQRQAYKFLKSFAEGSSGSADSQKLIQVHISLPCTGGSPLLDLSKKDRKPAQDAKSGFLIIARDMFHISRAWAMCVVLWLWRLPKSNRFWSDERLKKFLTDHDMQKFADCAACAMGLETSQGQPIGKVFRIACSNQVLATGLGKRFQCKCTQDHAPLNHVNYSMTERYSYKFARFYCRAIALRLDWSTGRNIVILFVIDCSLHFMSAVWLQESTVFFFSWTVQWDLHVCMVHSGFRDIRLSGTVFSEDFTKWILRFCHQESGDDISIDFRSLSTPLRECSHQDAHTPVVLFCCVCVFSFSCSPGRPRRVRQPWMSFSLWCYFLHWLEWWLDL